jgi:hypothetical protein
VKHYEKHKLMTVPVQIQPYTLRICQKVTSWVNLLPLNMHYSHCVVQNVIYKGVLVEVF